MIVLASQTVKTNDGDVKFEILKHDVEDKFFIHSTVDNSVVDMNSLVDALRKYSRLCVSALTTMQDENTKVEA